MTADNEGVKVNVLSLHITVLAASFFSYEPILLLFALLFLVLFAKRRFLLFTLLALRY